MPSLLPLVAAALASALGTTPAAPPIDLPLGDVDLPLEVRLELRTVAHPDAAAPAIAWRTRADGAVEGRARGAEWEAELVLAPLPGGARSIALGIRWTARAELERAALVLAWRGSPWAVTRSLGFAPLAGPERVERGTPLLVVAGPALLAGGPGLAAADLRATPGGVEAALVLDDAAARPFTTYETCLEAVPGLEHGQHVAWGALERRRSLPGAPRAPGEEDRLAAALYPVADRAPILPVIVERWPAGARAAVVFTDHADRTDPDALRAVLWGDSDPSAQGGVGAGFLGRGLRLTRSFFVHARRGGLDDGATRVLADDLAEAGSEVALHSITPDPDRRDEVRAGLAAAARWRPATWIDHEPYTNCEAVATDGWRTTGAYGIRDVLADAGVRWVWAAGDFGPGATRLVNLLGGAPDEARAAYYPMPLDPRLWVFRSSMFYDAPAALAAALSDDALARLEAERGLFVAHTYLGPSARTTHTADHLARLVVREVAPGRLVVDPELDAALARLAARVSAGRLASLTWVDAGDRLRALGDVEVAYRPDGAAEVRNHGEAAIPALTVAVPAAGLGLELEGALLLGRDDEDGWARIWFDLAPGGRVVVRASERWIPVPLVPFR
ncbi:proline dehydrogenase family protein [Anaeromyxobacter oryzae]|uniref:Uncharacterized protein n=1 Tax=Anaeromyxobacter oryzae TaxID=2918170 RepID=A0ABN6MYK1_9BACT|nr:hypothetical protein [Anaeromyxobacter oryzae]BDG04852.1 hypothetical protein AMOR_38480 [Anaeromyxobacter oryzae]